MTPYFQTELGALYHGNCFEILPKLSQRPTILLLDPMTGQGANTQGKTTQRGKTKILCGGIVSNKDWKIMPDDTPFDPTPWLSYPQVILWGVNHFSDKLPKNSKWIIWDKRCKNTNRDDNGDCEMAWTNLKGVSRVYHHLWKGVCREGEENLSIQGAKFHPFQKPVALMIFCLQECDLSNDPLVLDPFAGSCTTAVACERLGLRWIAIELLEHFCEIGAKRLELESLQIPLLQEIV